MKQKKNSDHKIKLVGAEVTARRSGFGEDRVRARA